MEQIVNKLKDQIARDILDLEDRGIDMKCSDKTYYVVLCIQENNVDNQDKVFDEIIKDLEDRNIL